MTIRNRRRDLLAALGSGILLPWASVLASTMPEAVVIDSENGWTVGGSNYHAIYDDENLRAEFLKFLQNVYSIYPPEKFHALIDRITRASAHDKEIYLATQSKISEIKPIASELRYGLPALFHQTRLIGDQLEQFLKERNAIDGYMEIGTKGGYIAAARSALKLTGDMVILHSEAASYGLGDMFERRGIFRAGRFVNLNNYVPIGESDVKSGSLDVVCNPIGFHHSPPKRRDAFVRSIRRCLRKGGELIVRDHDVDSKEMNHLVALAHDVFNMGLTHPWAYNQGEIRNFTSLQELSLYLTNFGFRLTGKMQYQDGDPTRNALMRFVAV